MDIPEEKSIAGNPSWVTWRAVSEQLLFLENPEYECNPLVQCPICKREAPLMDGFSLLAAGMNGIKTRSDDGVDLQECGNCGARLRWDGALTDEELIMRIRSWRADDSSELETAIELLTTIEAALVYRQPPEEVKRLNG